MLPSARCLITRCPDGICLYSSILGSRTYNGRKVQFFEIQQKNQKARAGSFKSNVIEVKSWLILLDTYSYVYIGDRSQILAHFLAYILVYVHVHHCKAIEVKSWLIFLDTYSYVNVHHCNYSALFQYYYDSC